MLLLLQGLYLLLVTNKASNILEDLETLRLLAKVVPEYVTDLHEEAIATAAFDLIFAFDEVISLGHKVSALLIHPRAGAFCMYIWQTLCRPQWIVAIVCHHVYS